MQVKLDIYQALANKWGVSRAIAKLQLAAKRHGLGSDPTNDGPELIVLRNKPESFYRRTIKYARDQRTRESVNIARVERAFCKKIKS